MKAQRFPCGLDVRFLAPARWLQQNTGEADPGRQSALVRMGVCHGMEGLSSLGGSSAKGTRRRIARAQLRSLTPLGSHTPGQPPSPAPSVVTQ